MTRLLPFLFLFILLGGCTTPAPTGPDAQDTDLTAAQEACMAGDCDFYRCVAAGLDWKEWCSFYACAEGTNDGVVDEWKIDVLPFNTQGSRATTIPASAVCAQVSVYVEGMHPDETGPHVISYTHNGSFIGSCEVAGMPWARTGCESRLMPFTGDLSFEWQVTGASTLEVSVFAIAAPKPQQP